MYIRLSKVTHLREVLRNPASLYQETHVILAGKHPVKKISGINGKNLRNSPENRRIDRFFTQNFLAKWSIGKMEKWDLCDT